MKSGMRIGIIVAALLVIGLGAFGASMLMRGGEAPVLFVDDAESEAILISGGEIFESPEAAAFVAEPFSEILPDVLPIVTVPEFSFEPDPLDLALSAPGAAVVEPVQLPLVEQTRLEAIEWEAPGLALGAATLVVPSVEDLGLISVGTPTPVVDTLVPSVEDLGLISVGSPEALVGSVPSVSAQGLIAFGEAVPVVTDSLGMDASVLGSVTLPVVGKTAPTIDDLNLFVYGTALPELVSVGGFQETVAFEALTPGLIPPGEIAALAVSLDTLGRDAAFYDSMSGIVEKTSPTIDDLNLFVYGGEAGVPTDFESFSLFDYGEVGTPEQVMPSTEGMGGMTDEGGMGTAEQAMTGMEGLYPEY